MKRFVCFLLAMILIMGMVSATAVTASAASEKTTSDKAIGIIKGSVTFYSKKDAANKIGYGTPTSFADAKDYLNYISKEDADALLRSYLKKEVDKAINAFTKSYNVDLTQQEHDALAVHMYRHGCGTGCTPFLTARVVKTVATAADRTAMVNAFVASYGITASGDEYLKANLNVAFAEAAMYLYGDYGYNGNNRFAHAVLDKNNNKIADAADEVVAYVKADGYNLDPLNNTTFLGWYLYDSTKKTITGAPLSKLTKDHDGKLIVANLTTDSNGVAVSYNITVSGLADFNLYNFSGSTPTRTNVTLKTGSTFKVEKEKIDADGVKWVLGGGTNTAGQAARGWVKIGKLEGSSVDINKPIATATITVANTKVYPGATSDGAGHVDTLNKDQVVNIYETKVEKTNYGNKVWGKITYKDGSGNAYFGWINLVNATLSETKGESGAAEGQTGVIANDTEVNIREAAGVGYNKLTALKAGTKVTVLEMNAERTWAKIKWTNPSDGYTQGWVYMHYVKLDSAAQGSSGTGVDTVLYTGIVTSNINLNVRRNPDVYATRVNSLPTGTKVNVYELASSRNMQWGRIGASQWVCTTYLNMTPVANAGSSNNGTSTEGTTALEGTVTATTLNVLKNYNSNAQKVGEIKKGDVVTILEKNTEMTTTGSRIWGRISTGSIEGWINLAYVDLKTVTTVAPEAGNNSSSNATPTPAIISDCISVNVRQAAGVYSPALTKLNNGTAVTVYEQTTYANAPWARIKWNNGTNEGWVCMYYVTLNAGTGSANTNSDGILNGTNSNTISATGYVNNAFLNVRSGAGLSYLQVGTLNQGAKVTVFEQAVADGMIWGRISYNNTTGWICMSYVTVENATTTGKGVMGTVARCNAKANVRSAPGTGNALVSTVTVGSRVEVFETRSHGDKLWGRIAQGWVCMDYILLDRELPEGTVLDATTAPTTVPTTAPTTEVKKEGEVAFKIEAEITATAAKPVEVYNDATAKSDLIGTITTNLNVDIRGLKNNGGELWGRIDQYGTAGWIRLSDSTVKYWFDGYVNEKDAPVYVDANLSSAVKGRLEANKQMHFTKVTTDGTNVYGWVADNIYGWLPMSKISSKPVELEKVYKSGDTVGTDTLNPTVLRGTTFAELNAYDVIGGSKVLFKMESGVNVIVTYVRFEGGRIWACAEHPTDFGEHKQAWFDLGKVNYSLAADTEVNKVRVRSSMDNSSTEEDTPNNIVGNVTGQVNICQLAFDSYGNLWARITGNGNTQLNGMFVMVRTAAQGVEGYEVKNYGKMFIGNHDVAIDLPWPLPDVTVEGEVLPEGDIDSATTPDMT